MIYMYIPLFYCIFPLKYISLLDVCKFEIGDGDGTNESLITAENPADCLSKCSSKRRDALQITGITVDLETGKKCKCEYSMFGRREEDTTSKSCFLELGKYYFRLLNHLDLT